MIPWSRKEASFDSASPSQAKGKLSMTKRRSSCSRFGMCRLLPGASDELVDDELGREHPDESHVVPDPEGEPRAELGQQSSYRDGIEDAVARQAFLREQLVHVLGASGAEEALCLRGAVGLLGPRQHRGR